MKREAVIQAIKKAKDDPEDFLSLVKQHGSKSEPFDLVEFFQALPKKQHGVVWSAIHDLSEHIVEGLGADSEDGKTDDTKLSLLGGVVTFCGCSMAVEDQPVSPPQLRETLQLLHDILLSFSEVAPDLQNSISQLCEDWWARGMEEAEGLVPHTLLYVVARTLAEGAIVADVKRVWTMRQAFLLLDFEDVTADSLKYMLLSTTLQPLYLKTEEGRKFLSFLFGMHPKFVEDLHQTIKNQIPHCPKYFLEIYGEIYYRAWRLASGPYLKQIEDHCIQDLMYCAVHAPRHGVHSLFHSIRKLLGYIHQQKSQKNVPEMLLRLYKPFLWRSLKVANPYVRANAVTLLFDAFPLQDLDSTREEIEEVMQKQFDSMTESLDDPSVLVRVTAIAGVCRVLSYFWELMPVTVIKLLLMKLVKDLAWDSSAINVRVAVIQGLCVVMENRLSHPLMRDLLPFLQNHLHDNSEKVRIAFLDLLLLVKGMRMVKFWRVCPIEHLLARMEVDSVHVVKRIVALLIDSFQPTNISGAQQIERCIVLIRANPGAARRFYQMAVAHLSPADVARFILIVHNAILCCVESDREQREQEPMDESLPLPPDKSDVSDDRPPSPDPATGDPIGIAKGGWREEGASERSELRENMEADTSTAEVLTLKDMDLMTGLLETMVVMWEGARERFDKPSNRALKTKLVGKIAEKLPLLFDTFKDGPSRSALYLLASYLPKKAVSPLVRGALQSLASLSYPPNTNDYTSLLVALVAWQQVDHVIKLTNQWLASEFNRKGDQPVANGIMMTNKTRGKRGTKVPLDGLPTSPTAQPMLAIEILTWMMSHPVCFEVLRKTNDFWGLSKLLKKTMGNLEDYFSSPGSATPKSSPDYFDIMSRCLNLYLRLQMHKGAESENHQEFDDVVMEVITWCERVLVPCLNETQSSKAQRGTRHSSRKRKADGAHPPVTSDPTVMHARSLCGEIFDLLAEILMVGLADGGLEFGMAEMAAKMAETASASSLLPSLSKLLYQLSEAGGKCEVEGIRSDGSLRPTTLLLEKMLSLLQNMAETDMQEFDKAWQQVKQCVDSAIMTSLRIHSLSLSGDSLAVHTTIVQRAIQAQFNHAIQHPSLEVAMATDDLPPLVRCLVKHLCKDEQSTSLFVSHLHTYLSECDVKLPDILMAHQASVNILNTLVNSKHGGDDIVRCLRSSIRLIENVSEEERQRWSGPVSELNSLIDTLQERLLH